MTAVIEQFQDMDQNRRDVLDLEVVLRDQLRDRARDPPENVPIREVDLILVDIVVIEENTQDLGLEVLEVEKILVIDAHLWKTSPNAEVLVMGIVVAIIQTTKAEVMVIIEIILVLRCRRVADMSAIVKTLRLVDVSEFLVWVFILKKEI